MSGLVQLYLCQALFVLGVLFLPERAFVGLPHGEQHGQRRVGPLPPRELADVVALAVVVAAVLLVRHPHRHVVVVEPDFPVYAMNHDE